MPKNKGGRPSKFKPEYVQTIYKLCELGATDNDLAAALNVSVRTINQWKLDHPTVFDAIKAGKKFADEAVVQAMYQRAIGYSHKDTKFATYEGVITDQKEYTKNYPPSEVAGIFWLTNRDPENWKRNLPEYDNGQEAPPLNITFEVKPAVSEIKVTNAKS